MSYESPGSDVALKSRFPAELRDNEEDRKRKKTGRREESPVPCPVSKGSRCFPNESAGNLATLKTSDLQEDMRF